MLETANLFHIYFLVVECLSFKDWEHLCILVNKARCQSAETVNINECTCQPVRIRPSGAGTPSPFPVPSLRCQTGLARYLVSGFPVGTVLRASEPKSLATRSLNGVPMCGWD